MTDRDDIDLIEFFVVLWEEKWLIFFLTILSLTIAVGYLYTSPKIYQSNIDFTVTKKPLFYSEPTRVYEDFKNTFYSKNNFLEWKKQNTNSKIDFAKFSPIVEVNGFTMSRNPDQLFAKIISETKDKFTILVATNDLLILKEFFLMRTLLMKS